MPDRFAFGRRDSATKVANALRGHVRGGTLDGMSAVFVTHVLRGSGRLTEQADRLQVIAAGSAERIRESLDLGDGDVDIVIRDAPRRTIPEIGIGGYNPDRHTVLIYLDPDHASLAAAIEQELDRCLAHELHHLTRRRGPGYGKTLFEALVSEGLADHFSTDHTGLTPPIWANALDQDQLCDAGVRAQAMYDEQDYDHGGWFFGHGGYALPRWTGYTLGYRLVADYLERNPTVNAGTLAQTPAATLRSGLA